MGGEKKVKVNGYMYAIIKVGKHFNDVGVE